MGETEAKYKKQIRELEIQIHEKSLSEKLVG